MMQQTLTKIVTITYQRRTKEIHSSNLKQFVQFLFLSCLSVSPFFCVCAKNVNYTCFSFIFTDFDAYIFLKLLPLAETQVSIWEVKMYLTMTDLTCIETYVESTRESLLNTFNLFSVL